MPTKYIVVLGSLLSGIGKGIVSSSIIKTLSIRDLKAMPLKFDGYLNYDCGTMNPLKHGEVFVLDDKSEVDMDFGTYERFLNKDLTGAFSMTGGKLFSEIIAKERKGDYLGNDVQIIPHLTGLIQKKILDVAKENELDVMLIEVGGTVGDIENSYFIEAMREFAMRNTVTYVMVTYIPELSVVGEQKTKPAQLALRSLMQLGIQPDFIITRSTNKLEQRARDKLALFSNLPPERIVDNHDTGNVYDIPINLMNAGFDKALLDRLGIEAEVNIEKLGKWKSCINNIQKGKKTVKIAVVGKYINLHDSYVSIKESIIHASASLGVTAEINWIESELLETGKDSIKQQLDGHDGILVPGGFGSRGTEGMINAIEYARTNNVPYLGICLGMQLMTVEYARNIVGLKSANSTEFNAAAEDKVIDIMESQKDIMEMGGSMRLGSWEAKVKEGTAAFKTYGTSKIFERHRHRYEVNNAYIEPLEKLGLVISATTPNGKLVEMVEWSNGVGMGTQAHPELKSRLERPAPLFVTFIKNASEMKN